MNFELFLRPNLNLVLASAHFLASKVHELLEYNCCRALHLVIWGINLGSQRQGKV